MMSCLGGETARRRVMQLAKEGGWGTHRPAAGRGDERESKREEEGRVAVAAHMLGCRGRDAVSRAPRERLIDARWRVFQ